MYGLSRLATRLLDETGSVLGPSDATASASIGFHDDGAAASSVRFADNDAPCGYYAAIPGGTENPGVGGSIPSQPTI